MWTENVNRAHSFASALDAGTVWVNSWLHRELHMPFGGYKASGVNREGGEASFDFYSEASTICIKLGDRRPPPMPGLRAASVDGMGRSVAGILPAMRGATAGASGARRGLSSSAMQPPEGGYVAAAPKPMGAYAHARRAGDLLFLAGIGPRDPTTDDVPGGAIEAPDGTRQAYDAAAQTRSCIANVRRVLDAYGLGLESVVR